MVGAAGCTLTVGAAGYTLMVGAAGHSLVGAEGALGLCPCNLCYALMAWASPLRFALRYMLNTVRTSP
jgi:hypothetical protein